MAWRFDTTHFTMDATDHTWDGFHSHMAGTSSEHIHTVASKTRTHSISASAHIHTQTAKTRTHNK